VKITDHTFFVTGANRGIGRAFVAGLLDRGAQKVYAAVRDTTLVDEELRHDPRVHIVGVDVTDPDQVGAAARIASDTSVLVNNAGIVAFESLLDGSLATARRQFDTNVFGVLQTVRAFAPAMTSRCGAIINVLSAAAWFSAPDNGAYCASKAAAWSITNGLRVELAPRGILVQGLHFGAVDTDFAASYDGPKITAEQVVTASLDGLERGQIEVLVDSDARAAKHALTGPPNAVVAP
jgi:NAD(P)-dependent dehydrogenase (short-subunit alcohol dehydrogenase family)